MFNKIENPLRQGLISEYENMLIDKFSNIIETEELGYISDNTDCQPILMSILIACMKNINIFSDEQVINISGFINTIRYAQ